MNATTLSDIPEDVDEINGIPMPINRLRVEGVSTDHAGMQDCLANYGHQIKHVEVVNLMFPMTPSALQFFEKLPKLTSLHIDFTGQCRMELGLKKLTLSSGTRHDCTVTDAVFCRVIRRMKLRELCLRSEKPIKSFESRLDPNSPFVTSIEMFPFDQWSLNYLYMSEDEFQQLAKQFPCNQF